MSKLDWFIRRLLPTASFLLVMIPAVAVASSPEWRPTYDLMMKYVNFTILAAVIYKYGREPIKNFLKQQKNDVVFKIEAFENENNRIIGEIQTAQMQAADNQQRLEKMKQRLIAQGENQKQRLIDQAHQQSAIMIAETEKKIEYQIVQAQAKLKRELADLAFQKALQQLPSIMTDSDKQRFVDTYTQSLQRN